jgi:immune inhibitor A
VFDDRTQYWNPLTPNAGVINPNTGTQVRVKSVSARGNFMQVEVRPAK